MDEQNAHKVQLHQKLIDHNDIYLLDTYGSLIVFANNTTLFNKHQSAKNLQFMLTHDMEVLSEWFKANKLSLNMKKTVLMYFGQKDEDFNTSLDHTTIPRVKHTKFLGTMINDNLRWESQVSHVLNKIHTNRHLLSLS